MSDGVIIVDGAADSAEIAEYERTRRDLVRRGVAVGGAVVAAASVPALLRARSAFAQSAKGDVPILQGAVTLEQTAVFVYEHGIEKILTGTMKAVALRFRDQEQEHLGGLTAALKALGAEPASVGPLTVADVKGLGAVKSPDDFLRFAVELETMGVAAYHDAQRKLKDAKLLQTGAAIMANEGQHLVVLRQALKQNPVPNAFETGAS